MLTKMSAQQGAVPWEISILFGVLIERNEEKEPFS